MSENSWDRQPYEPKRWYNIYVRYYLTLGIGRTVARAFRRFKIHDSKMDAEDVLTLKPEQQWYTQAAKWRWRERADDFDDYQSELALHTVEQAGVKLRLSAVQAVETLILSLMSERYGVQAAKEILDRAGLPATSRQEIDGSVKLTADELVAAAKEVDEWENETFEESS